MSMGLPRYQERENVIDYKESKKALQLEKIKHHLIGLGIDEKDAVKLARIVFYIKTFILGKI